MYSLFETMALGLTSDPVSAFMMTTSIALHQPAESIALLVAFLKTNLSQLSIIKWLSFYSCFGPLGVTAGMIVKELATPYISAVIVAITAGTFLYVGATEVLHIYIIIIFFLNI